MSLAATLGSDFPRRSITTNLVAGTIAALFVMRYVGLGHGAGFALGVLLGSLHLFTWIGLGREIVGERHAGRIALFVVLKLGVIYGGTISYLYYERAYAAAYVIGFSLIFFVMVQKVLGRKLLDLQKARSVT